MGCGTSTQTARTNIENSISSTTKLTFYTDVSDSERNVLDSEESSDIDINNKTRSIDSPLNNINTDKNNPDSNKAVVITKQDRFDTNLCRIHSFDDVLNKLTIIHFNDVYNIEAREEEPVGGAARFVTKVKSFPDEPLILFSGDCLNPSLSMYFYKIYFLF